MKERAEIKALAKVSFREQRGTGILLVLLFFVIVSTISGITNTVNLVAIGGFVLNLATFILSPVLTVGLFWGFLKIYRKEQTEVGILFSKFNSNFSRSLGGMLWMYLFLLLWSLVPIIGGTILAVITVGIDTLDLLMNNESMFSINYTDIVSPFLGIMLFLGMILLSIPVIIKKYAYSMTPFILADCANVKAKDALKNSMKMTQGNKGKLFVLDLSFIGWILLSILTVGILAIVFVGPYRQITWAGYYEELKAQALASGAITAEDLLPEGF